MLSLCKPTETMRLQLKDREANTNSDGETNETRPRKMSCRSEKMIEPTAWGRPAMLHILGLTCSQAAVDVPLVESIALKK